MKMHTPEQTHLNVSNQSITLHEISNLLLTNTYIFGNAIQNSMGITGDAQSFDTRPCLFDNQEAYIGMQWT